MGCYLSFGKGFEGSYASGRDERQRANRGVRNILGNCYLDGLEGLKQKSSHVGMTPILLMG